VFSCGFAGALDPALRIGDVVCAKDTPVPNAKAVTFTCAERVAITAAEKSALRERTGADAVEMESAVIERVCRESGVACIVLRAISDSAGEDLPLDFNRLMTAGEKLSSLKLAFAILRSPQKIPGLMRLGRNSALAAQRLAEVLAVAI
jgi:nucleoside phosphorylase